MKTNSYHIISTIRGTSLAELLVYIAVLSLISLALITSVSSILQTLVQLEAREEIAQAGIVSMERMTREIRRARAVDMVTSSLTTHPGVLTLDTTNLSGNPTTVMFSLSGGRVLIKEGLAAAVPISHARVTVTNLTFTHMLGSNTEGVLIQLTLEKTFHGTAVSKQFRTFAVLDAS